jgi:S1-C subfamily serine protease
VSNVKEVSAAGDANISDGDVISEVQGQKVTNVAQFHAAIDHLKSGQYARMYVTSFGRGGNSVSGYRVVQIP